MDAALEVTAADRHALAEGEVAKYLGLSVATLRAWRQQRRGPRFVRFGQAVRYLRRDVERFIEKSTVWPMLNSQSGLR